MIKYFGALFICLSVSSVGFICSEKLNRRIKYLESLKRFTVSCSDQMRFSGKTLLNILSEYSDDNLKFLSKINGDNIMKRDKLKEIFNEFSVAKIDMDAICDFFERLGSSDIDGQKSHCTYFFELFGSMLLTAQEELCEKGKLYKSLFTFLGLALFILII